MKKKVLFILSVPPPHGGGEIVSQYLYEHINNDYDCLTFPWKYYPKIRKTHFNFMSYVYGLYYIFRNLFKILIIRPESIYIGLPKTFIAFCRNATIIWFSNFLKIEIYCELHGMSFPFAEKQSYKRTMLIKTLSRVSKIRVLSDSISEYLKGLGFSGSIHRVHNGINKPTINAVTINKQHATLNLLYLGGISKSKGFHRVLKILKDINLNGNVNFHLNVVGSFVNSYEENEFIRYINKNNLIDLVTFHGHKVDQEKWNLVIRNQILMHLTSFDGQPLTIIECMSLGIPTIATKVGGIPEMIENNKNGFLVENEGDAVKIIRDIYSNKIDLNRISTMSKITYNNKYTIEKMVNGIVSMVES